MVIGATVAGAMALWVFPGLLSLLAGPRTASSAGPQRPAGKTDGEAVAGIRD